ncbi:MAG TPA: FecR domain-containing protein [Reyranella sp.]|nr:FecR domain-containing protein [Reyranella sp.]
MIFRLVRALAAAAFLLAPAAAGAAVGVTTAVEGEPTAAAPGETARTLEVGVDVEVGETIRTRADERLHLVFFDGTSLTVGPEAEIAVDRFDYDRQAKRGELALTARHGVLRLVGGHVSKIGAIEIKTPSSDLSLQGGIAIVDVAEGGTMAAFILGLKLTVTGAGRREILTRPGSSIVTKTGGAPQSPLVLQAGSLETLLGRLERGGAPDGVVAASDVDRRAAALNLPRHAVQETLVQLLQHSGHHADSIRKVNEAVKNSGHQKAVNDAQRNPR